MADTPQKLLTFPCRFPIKIIGISREDFAECIHQSISQHAPDYDRSLMKRTLSSKGNYESISVVINAVSQEQVDNIYLSLHSVEGVHFVL